MPPHKVRVVRPHVRTAVTNAPHPSSAPGRAYSQEFRALALLVREQGLEDEEVFQRARMPELRTTWGCQMFWVLTGGMIASFLTFFCLFGHLPQKHYH